MVILFDEIIFLFNGIMKQICRERLPVSNICNNRLPRVTGPYWCENNNNCPQLLVWVIAWFVVIFGIPRVIFQNNCYMKVHEPLGEWNLRLFWNITFMPNITTNHAIICLYYYPQKVCNFHMTFQIKLKYHSSKPIKLQKFLM